MIPLSLSIEGLYSYQEQQKIDFSELGKAHLFGIFGQVGSGKSTILEAISFVLYGKTDRLSTSDKRNYNMMNLKSDKMFISFEFTAGEDNSLYIAEAASKRNKKKFYDVNVIERKAYKLINGERKPIDIDELEDIIGLSYDNFKRTIIIPQGKFQEFLQLGSKERTQMMKELFGLGKYELSQNVSILESENNARKINLEGQLTQLGTISQEEIDLTIHRISNLEKNILELEIQLKEKVEEEVEIKKVKDQIIKLEYLKKQKAELSEKQEVIIQREKILNQFDYCQKHFKGIIEIKKSVTDKINSLEKSLINNNAVRNDLLKRLETEEILLNKLKPRWESREIDLKKTDELVKIKTINKLDSEIKNLEARILNGETIIKQNEKIILGLKERQELTNKNIHEIKSKMPDLTELSAAKAWHIENKNLIEGIKKANDAIAQLESDNGTVKTNVGNSFPEMVLCEISELPKSIDEKLLELNNEIIKINEHLDDFNVRARLSEFSESLKDGHACPLCGSTHHPGKYSHSGISEKTDELKTLKKGIETLIKKLTEQKQKLEYNSEGIKKAEKEKNALEINYKRHLQEFKWKGFEKSEDTDKAFDNARELTVNLKEQEILLSKTTESINAETASREKFTAALGQITSEKTNLTAQRELLLSQITLLNPAEYHDKVAEIIENMIVSIKKEIAEVTANFEKHNQEITLIQKSTNELKGSIVSEEKLLKEENIKLGEVKEQIAEKLKETSFSDLSEIETILSYSIDAEKEKKEISEFFMLMKSVTDQLEIGLSEIGNKTYSAENHRKITEEIQALQISKSKVEQEKGENNAILKRMNDDAIKISSLNKELIQVTERGVDLKTLKKLFHASGFVNFVSTAYLRNLCIAANTRFFKMTGQKLSLELSEENDFLVRDYLNGGNQRSIKTLSGGQTFQAALSMALALADNIQQLQKTSQNFFFLDEGFGTLDKNSILTVFETLKSLKKENRVVGIISHVEELQHDIEMNLKIVNDEVKGSLITKSWG